MLLVCVGCGAPLSAVYREYSRGNIRLSRCRACRSIGDKYVEWEHVLIFIDMMLQKVAVYRHLLINRPGIKAGGGGGGGAAASSMLATAAAPGHGGANVPPAAAGPPSSKAPGLPTVWKLVFAFLALDVYTRLYLHALDTFMPNLRSTAWLPMLAPHTAPAGGDGTCYAPHLQVNLLHQHSSLAAILQQHNGAAPSGAQPPAQQQTVRQQAATAADDGTNAAASPLNDTSRVCTACTSVHEDGSVVEYHATTTSQLTAAARDRAHTPSDTTSGLAAQAVGEEPPVPSVQLSAVVDGAMTADVSAPPPVAMLADVGDAVWQLPDLRLYIARFGLAACLELLGYIAGVLAALRVFGILRRSRLRVDPVTRVPLVAPSDVRRTPAATSATAKQAAASNVSHVAPSAVHPVVQPASSGPVSALPAPLVALPAPTDSSVTAAPEACGSDAGVAHALPSPVFRLGSPGLSPAVSPQLLPLAEDAPLLPAASLSGSGNVPGSLRPVRMHRSISTGNTMAAEAVRNEALAAEAAAVAAAAAAAAAAIATDTVCAPAASSSSPLAPSTTRRTERSVVVEHLASPSSTASSVASPPLAATSSPAMRVLAALPGHLPSAVDPAARLQSSIAAICTPWQQYIGPLRDVVDSSPPTMTEYASVTYALFLSSFGRMFVMLSMVWNYPASFMRMLTWFTLMSHSTALQALCDCTLFDSLLLVFSGYAVQLCVRVLLATTGVIPSFSLL